MDAIIAICVEVDQDFLIRYLTLKSNNVGGAQRVRDFMSSCVEAANRLMPLVDHERRLQLETHRDTIANLRGWKGNTPSTFLPQMFRFIIGVFTIVGFEGPRLDWWQNRLEKLYPDAGNEA